MALDLRSLSLIQSPTERRSVTKKMFEAEEYICLSDILIADNTAARIVLKLLEVEAREGRFDAKTNRKNPALRRTWRVKVLMDMWGQPVKPGATLEWKAGLRRRDENGRKYTAWDIDEMRRKGDDAEFVIYHAAVLDEDCCVTVESHDAILLLNQNGIHYATGLPISKCKELGRAPKPAPDGSLKHRHNWIYAEVPPGVDASTVGRPMRRRGGLAPVNATPAAETAETPAAGAAEAPKPKRTYNRKPKAVPPESESTP